MAGRTLKIGFMPLVDAAVLIVAHECGFAAEAGIDLQLRRDSSWANIRDKLSIQHLDGAHCLAPLVLAHHSLQPMLPASLTVPFMLNRGGGAITVSHALHEAITTRETANDGNKLRRTALALARNVRERQERSRRPLTFAMVSPFASHHYALRHWLHAGGLSPDTDVDLIALPPQLMVEALQQQRIDGFCAGAPWPQLAASTIGADILCPVDVTLSPVPEKALALQASLCADDAGLAQTLVHVFNKAAAWCADPAHRTELASLLARPVYLDVPASHIMPALETMAFYGSDVNRPDPAIARWYAAHMLAAGQLRPGFSLAQLRQPFDPAPFDAALTAAPIDLFADPLFDGSRFNADDPDAFVTHLRKSQAI
jgi:two-component system, oxyanion-binding sensor